MCRGGGERGFHCVHCGIVKVGVWGGGGVPLCAL